MNFQQQTPNNAQRAQIQQIPQQQVLNNNTNYNAMPVRNTKNNKMMMQQFTSTNYQPSNSDYKDDEEINIEKIIKENAKESVKGLNLSELITLKANIKNSSIRASSFVDQDFPVVVSLSTEKVKTGSKSSTDLVCVIDNSGSMRGQKLDLVKKTFSTILEYLDENDRLSVITFNSYAQRLTNLMRMTSENKQKTLSVINSISAGGGTNISQGMGLAYDVLDHRKYVNSVSGIFLLSDGQDGGALSGQWRNRKLKDSCSIHSFGYGADHNPELMTKVADVGDGNFYFIDKLDTVDEAFVDCLGSLISTIANDIQVSLTPNQSGILKGIKIKKVYGDESMWKKNGESYNTKSTYLISGKQKDYVMEVVIPKCNKELNDQEKKMGILSFKVTLKNMEGKSFTIEKDLEITLFNETEDILDEGDNKDVMRQFYRVKGGEALDQARQLADKGDNTEGQKLLKAIKEEIANSVVKDDQFIKNLIGDIDQAIEDVAPMNYASHGRHNMIGNARAQIQQRSYMQSKNNCFNTNMVQQQMVFETKNKKNVKY